MKHKIIISILMSLFAISCSQGEKKTSAKLKLNLSGITNISSGIGSGGAILFGKNAAGDTFGKKINAAEEDLELPNGAWVFYALMWGNESTTMNGKVHCGKTINQLNGTATTISMSLTNANCTDPEFSGGKAYIDSSLNRFADIFIEECDSIIATTGFSCGKNNQGSALSYRFVFNNYKKSPAGFVIEGESLVSECKLVNASNTAANVYSSGLPINFPSGGVGTPFIGSIEFFMSSTTCDVSDPKGVQRFPLHQGLATSTAPVHHVLVSSNSCTPSTPDFTSGTTEEKKNKCDQFFGTWNGSTCTGVYLPVNTRFAPAAVCTNQTASNIAIKHQFMIPKTALCAPYMNNSTVIGSHPFAGGIGSVLRPYKICTEWQLNQIGERNTALNVYDVANYKLVNDLDMNKASTLPGVGTYAAPECVGNVTSGVDAYHNLTPLDGHLCANGTSNVGFTGVFDGDNHVIANARITAEKLSQVGFARLVGTREVNGASGTVKNIIFKNLSVRGLNNVGGVAGDTNGNGMISNVKIFGGEVEAQSNYSGGVSGNTQGNTFIYEKLAVKKFKVRGTDYIGGLIGQHTSSLKDSMFSGHITSDQTSSPLFSGGLVGTNAAGATISGSFSEGYIATHTQYVGGIAAKNYGNMDNVYSTMAISSLRNDPASIYIGGIAAYSDGNITNCFSDTRKMYVGGATLSYSGTVYSATGSIISCFTDATNNSTHITTTYSNLRNSAWLNSNFLVSITTPALWKVATNNGVTPRLSWEQRDCLLDDNLMSVSLQSSSLSRGTLANPIVICTDDQFLSMNNRSSSEYYRMADSINLSNWGVSGAIAAGVSNFYGKLNAEGNSLYGLDINIDNVMDNEVGIFKTISSGALVSNLNLYANRVYTSSDTVNSVGLLSNTNVGEISNVKSFGSSVVASNYMGTFAVQNNGVIKDSKLESAHMVGTSYVGGVTAVNNGSILRTRVSMNMGSSSSMTKAGGITGVNLGAGLINQVEVNGEMNIIASPVLKVGGLVGENNGNLRNAFAARLNMNLAITGSGSGIGGLVGENFSGNIENVFFAGKITGTQSTGDLMTLVDTDGTTDERSVGPIVGKVSSGAMTSALAVNDYLLWGPYPSIVSSCNAGTNSVLLTASFSGGSSGVLAHHSTAFLVPFSYSSNTIMFPLTSIGGCPANAESLNLYVSYHNFAEYGDMTAVDDFKSLSYLTGKSFNVALDNDSRVLNYHLALMNGTPVAANTPIWTLEDGEEYPRLLQLEH